MDELRNDIRILKAEIEEIRYLLHKKIGGGSADIKGHLPAPSTANVTLAADSVTSAMIASGAVKQSELAYEEVTVNVTAGQTSGTGTATSGSVIVGYRPAGNVDQAIDSIAISGTTVTVTLGAAATAQN